MKKAILVFLFLFCAVISIEAQKVPVTFNADMRVKTKELKFTPGTSLMYVRGSFNGWSQDNQMTDANNDTIYTITVDTLNVGDTLAFKYFFTGPDTWENDPNRSYIVKPSNNVFTAYFDNDSVVTLVGSGSIIFSVDMGVMEEVGIYNLGVDSAQIRGTFNGWSDTDPAKSRLAQNVVAPNQWYLNVPFVNAAIETQSYKFYADVNVPNTIWTDGYERPLSRGGGNREIMFLGQTNQTAPNTYFDDVLPDYVIENNKNLSITFRVDMTNAMNSTLQPIPFTPQDTLYWICESPTFTATQGWVDSDQMRYLKFTREGTSNIWAATLAVADPSFNGFEYRYAFARNADGAWISEPSGFSAFAYRVRYIRQTAPRTFVQPYTAPVDTWTNAEIKTDQESGPMSVEIVEGPVVSYSLNQNYPNPFNPSTKISFTITKPGMVSLKVFNALGQEVATLLNEELSANNYEIDFNASKLSSGVYFYSIQSGDFSATKKMILMK